MSDELRSDFDAATENKILLGQQSGSIGGLQERAGIAQVREQQREKDRQSREETSRYVEMIAQLRSDLADMEERFRARDGDAWRENLALKILEPDEFPQRREGESIEAYRERLEKNLIEDMLNPDGSIKEEYKNHHEYSDYAQWAQKKFHYNRARGLVRELDDENTTPEREAEIEEQLQESSLEELNLADETASTQSNVQTKIRNISDETLDEMGNSGPSSANINDLLKPIS